jgi:hypothetical protein
MCKREREGKGWERIGGPLGYSAQAEGRLGGHNALVREGC